MEVWTLRCLLVGVVLASLGVEAPPPTQKRRQQAGPCVGMDCLHGVMMHGDADPGDDHRHEDGYRRRQAELEERARRRERPGGPRDGMDTLHGVLMHGDTEPGATHAAEHGRAPDGPARQAGRAGPEGGMDFLHGVLMHGDTEPGATHAEEHRRRARAAATAAAAAAVEGKEKGPCVGMDCLHGVLMHGDEETGDAHAQEHDDKRRLLRKESVAAGASLMSSPDLEAAMHGGESDVHGRGGGEREGKHDEGVPSISDPHLAIHGRLHDQLASPAAKQQQKQQQQQRLRQADDKEDRDQADYTEWLKENKRNNRKDSGSGGPGSLGFSFPFISDTLLDNIDLLKRRYMPKFWGGASDVTDSATVAPSGEKEANEAVGGEGAHDMLSDLDVVGGTAPLKPHNHGSGRGKRAGREKEGSGRRHDEG